MNQGSLVPLGQIAVSIRNGLFARRPNDDRSGTPILRISAVRDGRVSLSDLRYVQSVDARDVEKYSLQENDLLITRYNGSRKLVGTSGLVPVHGRPLLHPDKLIRVQLDAAVVDPRFVNLQLASPRIRDFLEPRIRTTAGQSGIAGGDVRAVPLWLPPLLQQRRIVEILEDHLSRLDAAKTDIATALRRVDLFLASSLNGFLWQAHGVEWVPLGDLAVKSGYGTSAKCVAGGPGPAVVRIPNLVDGKIELSDEKRVQDPTIDVSSLLLHNHDLLFIRTNGSRDLIGRTAVVQPGVDAAFASYLIRYRFDTSTVRPEWVHLAMRTPSLRAQLESLAASSAGQYNLSLGKLNQLTIPVPSLAEQNRLIADLADLDDQVVRLRVTIDSTSGRQARLRGTLLAAAFSGQLTSNSPDEQVLEELAGV